MLTAAGAVLSHRPPPRVPVQELRRPNLLVIPAACLNASIPVIPTNDLVWCALNFSCLQNCGVRFSIPFYNVPIISFMQVWTKLQEGKYVKQLRAFGFFSHLKV
jgi:hypothetical protein